MNFKILIELRYYFCGFLCFSYVFLCFSMFFLCFSVFFYNCMFFVFLCFSIFVCFLCSTNSCWECNPKDNAHCTDNPKWKNGLPRCAKIRRIFFLMLFFGPDTISAAQIIQFLQKTFF